MGVLQMRRSSRKVHIRVRAGRSVSLRGDPTTWSNPRGDAHARRDGHGANSRTPCDRLGASTPTPPPKTTCPSARTPRDVMTRKWIGLSTCKAKLARLIQNWHQTRFIWGTLRHGHFRVGHKPQTWPRHGRIGNACPEWPRANCRCVLHTGWRLHFCTPVNSNSPQTSIVRPSLPHHNECHATAAQRNLARCSPAKRRGYKRTMAWSKVDSWVGGSDGGHHWH